MIRDHSEYAWEIGREPYYFLLALKELKRRLEDRRINWMFHSQSNILRTNESESMLQFVSIAFSCMDADQTYETWIKYFGIVPSPKPAVKTPKSAPPQITVAIKPLESPVYNYDTDDGSNYNQRVGCEGAHLCMCTFALHGGAKRLCVRCAFFVKFYAEFVNVLKFSALGAIHKRRLLIGRGKGANNRRFYLVKRRLRQGLRGREGGHKIGKMDGPLSYALLLS